MWSPAVRVAAFFVPAVIITRLLATALWPGSRGTPLHWVKLNLLMLVPGLVAWALVRLVLREPARPALGLRWNPNRWWLVALLAPLVLAAAKLAALLLLVPGTQLEPGARGPWSVLPLPSLAAATLAALIAGVTVLIPGALGEESAWRGFLVRELRGRGFWTTALVIGALWAVWHLPATLDPERLAGPLRLALSLVLLTPVILYLRLRAGSVWAAVLFHAVNNTAGHFPRVFVAGGEAAGWWRFAAAHLPEVIGAFLIWLALRRERTRPSPLPRAAQSVYSAGSGDSPDRK